MFNNIFQNYEPVKLPIQNPNIANLFILVILCFLSILLLKRNSNTSNHLSRIQTDQLRGIAIIFIILGHLWVHVSINTPAIVLGGEAVALFLILSGFGLTISSKNRIPSLKYFLSRRLKRVMVPYWIVTILIISLDYLFLNRKYCLKNIFFTFLGVNTNSITKHIDYVRWYITFLIFWYIIFFFAISKVRYSKRILFLISCAIIIFPLDYYVTHFGWYQIFAFPIGCAIGQYYNEIQTYLIRYFYYFIFLAIICILYYFLYKIKLYDFLIYYLPSIIFKLYYEFNSILLSLCLIIFISYIGFKSYYSSFLVFCGKISYELFLLHGAFLIKYNPFFRHTDSFRLSINFIFFLVFIILLSYSIQIIIKFSYDKVF